MFDFCTYPSAYYIRGVIVVDGIARGVPNGDYICERKFLTSLSQIFQQRDNMVSSKYKLILGFIFSIMSFHYYNVYEKLILKNIVVRSVDNKESTRNLNQSNLCPSETTNITKHISIDFNITTSDKIGISNVEPGGRYSPPDCVANHRVAIIIPFRNREATLKILLRNLHPYLQRRKLHYRVFLVEQVQEGRFNKGIMMNTGFVEANKLDNYTCFIFQDADLLPEHDGVPYTCDPSPLHLAVAVDTLNYTITYPMLFGGVTGFKPEHFKQLNGFSNIFFAWGGEDDDMYKRVVNQDLKINRLAMNVGRYKMLKHKKEKRNNFNGKLLKTSKLRQKSDGLNSLKSDVVKIELKPLYTWILVRVNETLISNSVFGTS